MYPKRAKRVHVVSDRTLFSPEDFYSTTYNRRDGSLAILALLALVGEAR